MTNESENALPLDDSFWEHLKHADFVVAFPVSETRNLNVMEALRDIYYSIDKNPEEAKFLLTAFAGIIVAAKQGKGNEVYNEIVIAAAKLEMDDALKELLDEK